MALLESILVGSVAGEGPKEADNVVDLVARSGNREGVCAEVIFSQASDENEGWCSPWFPRGVCCRSMLPMATAQRMFLCFYSRNSI